MFFHVLAQRQVDKLFNLSGRIISKEFHVFCEVDNVLTKEECTDIIGASSICNFQDMDSKYDPKNDRNYSAIS